MSPDDMLTLAASKSAGSRCRQSVGAGPCGSSAVCRTAHGALAADILGPLVESGDEMAGASTGRSAGWPLVGRAVESARAAVLLEEAAQGRGRVLLVSGPAGIGKSRLAEEILALAAQRGFVTHTGGARLLGQGLAYAPLLEAIGPHLAGLANGPRVRLVDGLADLGRLFVDLHLPPAPALGDPALERTRLFEAVARLLGRLAAQAPVVLAVDDLHWADDATVELLHYVARGIGAHRLLLLCAYRSDEVAATPAAQALVRDLRRAGLAQELDLAGLGRGPIRSLAAAMLGGEPPQLLVDALVERAAGSPLVVTALVDELVADGALFRSGGAWVLGPGALDLVPAVVRDLVVERLRRLPVEQRAALEGVALAGDGALPAVLADALDVDEGLLVDRLRALAVAGLAVETVRGGEVVYCTSHPLYAEVAGTELGEAARRRLHAAVAAALERHRPGVDTLLAPHYRDARDQVAPARALQVVLAAGERALQVQAGAEAVPYLEAARSYAVLLGDEDRTIAILELLAEAEQSAGRVEPMIAAWQAARDAHRRRGDRIGVARACRQLTHALWDRGLVEQAWAALSAGFAAIEAGAFDEEGIRLRETRLQMLARRGESAAVRVESAELLALSTAHGLSRAVAYANLYRSFDLMERGEYTQLRLTSRGVLAEAERIGDLFLVDHAYRQLMAAELTLGQPGQLRSTATEALGRLRTVGVPSMESAPLGFLALAGFLTGDWDGAQSCAAQLLTLGHRVGSDRIVLIGLALRALVLAHRGRLDAAAACLAEVRAGPGALMVSDRHAFGLVECLEAVVALERGRPEEAIAAVDDRASATAHFFATLQIATLCEAQLAADRIDAARATAARIAHLGAEAPFMAAIATRMVGLIAHRRGDLGPAGQELRTAAERFGELAMPFEVARCRLEWARVAVVDHPVEAVGAAQEALTTFVALDARRFADGARSLLRDLGERPAPRRRGKLAEGLSLREIEVVRLVAEGLSNAEIAARLVISPRTVTTHLQHVYARLGLSSRVALVRHAVEHDLLVAPDT